MEQGTVTVLSGNIFEKPLLSSEKANLLVIRDKENKPILVLSRYAGDTWVIGTAADKDFSNLLLKYGVK